MDGTAHRPRGAVLYSRPSVDSGRSQTGFTRLERGRVERWLAAGYLVAVTDWAPATRAAPSARRSSSRGRAPSATTTPSTLDVDGSAGVDVTELVAAIRAFCVDPAASRPGAWLFGVI